MEMNIKHRICRTQDLEKKINNFLFLCKICIESLFAWCLSLWFQKKPKRFRSSVTQIYRTWLACTYVRTYYISFIIIEKHKNVCHHAISVIIRHTHNVTKSHVIITTHIDSSSVRLYIYEWRVWKVRVMTSSDKITYVVCVCIYISM